MLPPQLKTEPIIFNILGPEFEMFSCFVKKPQLLYQLGPNTTISSLNGSSLAAILKPLHNSYVLGERASVFAKSDYATYRWVEGVYATDVGQSKNITS